MSDLTTQLATDVTDCFLKTTEFADAATYTPSGGSPASVVVLFEAPYSPTNPLTGFEYENAAAMALGKTTDFASAKTGDTLIVSGTTYYVIGVHPDGLGMTALILSLEAQHG